MGLTSQQSIALECYGSQYPVYSILTCSGSAQRPTPNASVSVCRDYFHNKTSCRYLSQLGLLHYHIAISMSCCRSIQISLHQSSKQLAYL